MNVLILGGGGREHAMALAATRSPRLRKLVVLPGNAGTATIATNVPGNPSDVKLALEVARREQIDLTIVGPEEPLAAGIVDAFQAAGLRAFGPVAAAARLESDKAFAKQLLRQQAVPTAEGRIFNDFELAREYIASRDEPLVVKAAGLAKGKGVVMCADPAEALIASEQMLVRRRFGDAGATIVVEERLVGREVSVMAIVDGTTLYMLEPAQDYKRLSDGDSGPNTGGMGAFCPCETLDERTLRQVQSEILVPTLAGLAREDIHFRGVLYAGLMLTHGGPRVLEFNCRLGDPETQVVLTRLQSDFLELIEAAVSGRLDAAEARWDPRHAVAVTLAAPGYPETVRTGAPIDGLDTAESLPEVVVMHAGTRADRGRVWTAGGRVLNVVGLGATRDAARARAYAGVDAIRFDGLQCRRDIGS